MELHERIHQGARTVTQLTEPAQAGSLFAKRLEKTMNEEIKTVLLNCKKLIESEYGDHWQILSNDSHIKQTMLGLNRVLDEDDTNT